MWLVILAAIALAGAHWAARSGAGKKFAEERVSFIPGMKATVDTAKLDFFLRLVATNVKIEKDGIEYFTADKITMSGLVCGERRVRIARPRLAGYRVSSGRWNPSIMKHLDSDIMPLKQQFTDILYSLKPDYALDVTDAEIVLHNEDGSVVKWFSSVYWKNAAARIENHPNMRYNKLTINSINDEVLEIDCDWLSEGRAIFPLSDTDDVISIVSPVPVVDEVAPVIVEETAPVAESPEETKEVAE